MLDHIVRVCLVLQETTKMSFNLSFAFPLAMNEGVLVAPYSQWHLVSSVLDFGHSKRFVVVFPCFNLNFPDDISCGAPVHVLICQQYKFGEVFVRPLVHFLIGLFSYYRVLKFIFVS